MRSSSWSSLGPSRDCASNSNLAGVIGSVGFRRERVSGIRSGRLRRQPRRRSDQRAAFRQRRLTTIQYQSWSSPECTRRGRSARCRCDLHCSRCRGLQGHHTAHSRTLAGALSGPLQSRSDRRRCSQGDVELRHADDPKPTQGSKSRAASAALGGSAEPHPRREFGAPRGLPRNAACPTCPERGSCR